VSAGDVIVRLAAFATIIALAWLLRDK